MNAVPFTFDEEPYVTLDRVCPDILLEGDVVSIPYFQGQARTETPIFIRQHLVEKFHEMKQEFENTKLLHAYVTSAPGSGKTCFFWLWALMKAQDNKRVLFIQHDRRDAPGIWVLENNMLKTMTYPKVEHDNLKSLVRDLLERETGKFDFAIFDGVEMTEEMHKGLISELKCTTGSRRTAKISKVVFVTSLELYFPTGDVCRGVRFNEGVDIEFDSWSETDYDRAGRSSLVQSSSAQFLSVIRERLLNDWKLLASNSNNDPNEDVSYDIATERVREAIKLKYRYAGGCVRFMFEYDMDKLKARLDQLLHEVATGSKWDDLAHHAVTMKTPSSVNLLMQRFAVGRLFHCVPVSEYVLYRAYQVCRGKMTASVVRAANISTNYSPSLAGWAFELQELDKIVRACEFDQHPHASQRIIVIVDIITPKEDARHEISFCPLYLAKFDGKQIEAGDGSVLQSGTVIWCDIWNQGGFDVAVYFGPTLVTFQVMWRKSPTSSSLELVNCVSNLRSALTALNAIVNEVVHVSIVKTGTVSEDLPNIQQEVGHYRYTGSNTELHFCIKAVKARALTTKLVANKGTLSFCRLDETDNAGVVVHEVAVR